MPPQQVDTLIIYYITIPPTPLSNPMAPLQSEFYIVQNPDKFVLNCFGLFDYYFSFLFCA